MNQTHCGAHPPQTSANPSGRSPYPIAGVLVMATVAGLLLGPVDLLAQTTLPYPWANLANSGAVWALAAFILGSVVRPLVMSAAAGLVLLPVAVESYYLACVIFRHDAAANLWSSTTGLWLVLGAVVGPLFGLAGGALRSRRRITRFTAAACSGGIFALEALVVLARSRADGSSHAGQTAFIEFALAVAVPLGALALTRTRR